VGVAAQQQQQRVRTGAPAPQFYTKRVADPNMIPLLVAAGVEFGAVKVPAFLCRIITPLSSSEAILAVAHILHASSVSTAGVRPGAHTCCRSYWPCWMAVNRISDSAVPDHC
jgi:hypothetical protein